jgi:hypothetical protein
MKNIILISILTILLISCSSDNEVNEVFIEYNTELDFMEVFSFQVDTLELDMASSVSVYLQYQI